MKILEKFGSQVKFSNITAISQSRLSLIIGGYRPTEEEREIIVCALGPSKTLFYNKEV
jgi:hypothetical protein